MAKLVRDRIPEIAPNYKYRRADEREVLKLLLDKVVEEALELREKPSIEEIADVYEALLATAKWLGHSWEEVEKAAEEKRARRGGFEGLWVQEV